MISSPLPCSINRLHGRSVAILTFGRDTVRLCATCQHKAQRDVSEFQAEWVKRQSGQTAPGEQISAINWLIIFVIALMAAILIVWAVIP